jgi:hypothetical protein
VHIQQSLAWLLSRLGEPAQKSRRAGLLVPAQASLAAQLSSCPAIQLQKQSPAPAVWFQLFACLGANAKEHQMLRLMTLPMKGSSKKVKLLKKRRQTSEIDQNEFASFSDEAEWA